MHDETEKVELVPPQEVEVPPTIVEEEKKEQEPQPEEVEPPTTSPTIEKQTSESIKSPVDELAELGYLIHKESPSDYGVLR